MNLLRIFTAIALLVSEMVSAESNPQLVPIQDGGIVELEIESDIGIDTFDYLAANINRPGIKLVFINIDSRGGSLQAALKTVDLFKSTPAKIVCRDEKLAASAAMVIFQACDLRTMEADATMVAHGAKMEMRPGAVIGHLEATQLANAIHALNETCVQLMLGRTSVSPLLALQLFDGGVDMEIDAAMAVEIGAVDLVLPKQLD